MRRPKYRLSPNEVEQLIKEDREKKRKLRIVQVREQAKANAAAVRNDVKREKERLLTDLADEIKEQLEAEKDERIRKLEQKYENTLRTIGEGHQEAHLHGDGQNRAEKLLMEREAEEAAQERYRQALDRQRKAEAEKEYEENKHILARQAALEKEKERAAEIASLPPPPPDISVEVDKAKKKSIPMVDMQAFATTHYHIPDYQVVRANSEEQLYNAKSQAEESDLKLQQDLVEKKRSQHERIERARIRGNEALQKEMLKNDYGDMLKDLSLLQRKDRRRRQKILSNVPLQVFIPPERCLEERQERQMEMERKFEDLYMQQNKIDQLQSMDTSYPQTMDSINTSGQDTLGTLEADFPMTRINPALRDLTNMAPKGEASQSKKPETVLKQLLSRIKEQRDNVPANQGAASATRGNQKPLSDVDSQSVMSVESKADWQKAETEGTPNLSSMKSQHKSPSRVDFDSLSQGQIADDSKSDVDSVAISHNDRLIEELKRRIDLIESQKEKLSHQFQAQSSFHRHLRSDILGDVRQANGEESNASLREVDITGTSLDTEKDSPSHLSESRQEGSVRVWQSDHVAQPRVDLVSVASNLKPVTGILKGARNTRYELLTSNGFLPAPEMMVADREKKDVDSFREENNSDVGGGSGVNIRAFTPVDHDMAFSGRGAHGGSARREINFGSDSQTFVPGMVGLGSGQAFDGPNQIMPGTWPLFGHSGVQNEQQAIAGSLKDSNNYSRVYSNLGFGNGVSTMVDQTTNRGNVASVPSLSEQIGPGLDPNYRFLQNQDGSDVGELPGLLGDGQNHQEGTNICGSDGHGPAGTDQDMARKLREYRDKAGQRHVGMDEETLRRVREYQQKLVRTHEDRKKLLADVRADIERRRQELYSSNSNPVRGGSNRLGQSLLESWGQARGERPSVLTDRTKPEGGQLGSDPTDSYRQWKPIQPFIADRGRTDIISSVSRHMTNTSNQGLRSTDGVDDSHRTMAWGNLQGKKIQNESDVDAHRGRGMDKVDKIRKSLSFEDGEESMNASRVSLKDVLNDTSASKLSQATTDESRLMSSEEERGSPILHYSRSEKSEISDKSNNSVTGSSSLNGSALVARAEERRMGFERRQEELQHQLMDIQQQKELILQKYYAGQQALMQQQTALRSKLATAAMVMSGKDLETNQQMELRAKLAEVNAQIGSSVVDQEGLVRSDPPLQLVSGRNPMDTSKDSESTSGRPSTETPGNVSKDSYLAEISYHKIKSGDYKSLPSSAFEAREPDLAQPFPMPKNQGQGSQMQTWASLLRSSNQQQKQHQLEQQEQHETSLSFNSDDGPTYDLDPYISATKPGIQKANLGPEDFRYGREKSADSDMLGMGLEGHQDGQSSRKTPPLTAQPVVGGLADHQPHELSTILEVDTPTSSSAMTSAKKMMAAKANSSQSLSSQGTSSDVHSSKLGSDFKMDVFRDSPYTFPTGGATGVAFDLARGERKDHGDLEDSKDRSRSTISLDSASALTSGKGDVIQMKAKRLLDFSKEHSGDQKWQEFLNPEEDLFHTAMPALIELTPRKPWQIHETVGTKDTAVTQAGDCSLDDEGSSFQVSGYSQYLRARGEGTEPEDSDMTGTSLSLTGYDIPSESSATHESNLYRAVKCNILKPGESDGEKTAAYIPGTSEALQQARVYSPSVVEQFRQQSKAVFGDDTGEGDTTDVSAVPSTSLSMNLEEVSMVDTTQGTCEGD